jgi:peptide chain release factor 3
VCLISQGYQPGIHKEPFKIQANIDPNHRDRVAYMLIVSGKFERGMKSFHVRSGKQHRLKRPTQFMSQDRSLVDEAFAGHIVGKGWSLSSSWS